MNNEKKVKQVIRENFDIWDEVLIPILRARHKPVNEYLSRLLAESGYEISANVVGVYLSQLRKERNEGVQ